MVTSKNVIKNRSTETQQINIQTEQPIAVAYNGINLTIVFKGTITSVPVRDYKISDMVLILEDRLKIV